MQSPIITEENNYLWLLVALLALLFAAAVFEQLGTTTLRRTTGFLLTVLTNAISLDTRPNVIWSYPANCLKGA